MNERLDHEFRAHLELHDKRFFLVIRQHPVMNIPEARPPFEALVRIVAGQQLSVQAAATVFGRLKERLNGEVTVEMIKAVSPDTLRLAGLSGAKTKSILVLADFAGPNSRHLQSLLDLPWDELRATLMTLKGIGPWSVDMFGMFGLGLPDVFSSGDLGLRVAMQRHLGLAPNAKPEVYQLRAETWKPFRTMASLHLWHSLKPDHERFISKI